MIPIVGVVFEIIPLILLAVSARSLLVFIGLLAALLVIHTAAFIVFLKLMRGYTRTNPVIMIFSIIFFGQVLGIVGAFLAVPLTIILKQFWEHFISPWFERDVSGESS
jgi:predicted PurR-regulated permease PerM